MYLFSAAMAELVVSYWQNIQVPLPLYFSNDTEIPVCKLLKFYSEFMKLDFKLKNIGREFVDLCRFWDLNEN
jgi:hypothetical protein